MTNSRKKYRTILPDSANAGARLDVTARFVSSSKPGGQAPAASESATWVPEAGRELRKRKRIGTQIACNACRQRKARCDGLRPQCGWCRDKSVECIYADERSHNPLDSQQAYASQILELLRSEPEGKAAVIVKAIREKRGSSPLLPMIKEAMKTEGSCQSLSSKHLFGPYVGLHHTTGLQSNSTLESELMAASPISYPSPPPLAAFSSEVSDPLRSMGVGQSIHGDEELMSEKEGPRASTEAASSPSTEASPAPRGTWGEAPGNFKEPSSKYCDKRLHSLDISVWTKVPITSQCAGRVISLYLETDHPLLGTFDPDVFIEDLAGNRNQLCSSFLVNALLFLGCQMYCALDEEAFSLVQPFCEEAERLWGSEHMSDSLANLAALQLISLAYIGHGTDHCVLRYRHEACSMATRMSLLGVEPSIASEAYDKLPEGMRSPSSYAAWGTFNWTVLTSLFYHQPGFQYPEHPPVLPVPGAAVVDNGHRQTPSAEYMGETLPALCKFWRILHSVSRAYHKDMNVPGSPSQYVSLDFAELKYRELLAFADSLPPSLVPSEDSPHHVVIFHIWFHAAVLDLYRPFLRRQDSERMHLESFYSKDNTPDAAFEASVKKLKHLILFYRSKYPSSTYTILWHTGLVYVANAVLQDTDDPEWRFYFLLCIYGYVYLRRSYRLAEAIGRALLSMTLRHGSISPEHARKILKEIEERGVEESPDSIRATFMADLDLAMTDPGEASVDTLAHRFEDLALFQEFTNIESETRNEGLEEAT